MAGPARSRLGAEMSELGVLNNASVVVGSDGNVAAVSTDSATSLIKTFDPEHVVDCTGRTVFPGFIDMHTHTVFAGDRR